MREIKFRAWDKSYEEMIYSAERTYDYGCNAEGSSYHEHFGYLLDDEDCEVMQYTGLKDKNGKEIYEEDIIYNSTEEENFVVEWFEEGARYVFSGISVIMDFDNCYEYELEVIGNIYENPELLGDD